ncbi:PepSY-associated TM helix domain-containing protein [Henriciella aquimarina]|uniref:PepSY-associated TM helix domain-containing protein n=1 Tax=Henriciella aquimarina TaxID=545261 RepID=UPI000A06CAFE|nr:PepSY-associated TM helix domain-containing protein [Henriciella aquimarina]
MTPRPEKPAASSSSKPASKPRKKFNKGAFYRTCRMLHAYLSAGAFIALMFFALSGLLLNHPGWFGADRKDAAPVEIQLAQGEVAEAAQADDPAEALAGLVKANASVKGAYRDGDFMDEEAFLRFTGVKGTTDVIVNTETGLAEIEVSRANLTSIIHDLHRGKDAGAVWKAFIDVTALLIMAMSLVGLILFFSLRFRLATSMKIIGGTVVAFTVLYLFFTV